jgi:hypothetical protein
MKSSVVALLAVCLLALLPAGASGAASAEVHGVLYVSPWNVRDDDLPLHLEVFSSPDPAKVTLSAPSGYPVELGQAPGTRIGFVGSRFVWDSGRSSDYLLASLVAEDPARYLSDASAQTCAPGSHAAVWRATFSLPFPAGTQQLDLPIFVDRAATAAEPSAVLRVCLPGWRLPDGSSAVATSLRVDLVEVFGVPTKPGRNTWSALVTPRLPTLAPDESRRFEVRASEPVPHVVTLEGRYDAKTSSVVLDGRITAAGEPDAGVTLGFARAGEWSPDQSRETFYSPEVSSGASGEFTVVRRGVKESTAYFAHTFLHGGPCREPSSAPAGCLSETVAKAPVGVEYVRIRRPTDAKLAPRTVDDALARRIALTVADLPGGWSAGDLFVRHRCRASIANLSRLTARGYHETERLERRRAAASSRVTVYASERQARTAFGREARMQAASCLAADYRKYRSARVLGVRAIPFAKLGEERRAFRIVLRDEAGRRSIDLISFRLGRAVVHLAFEALATKHERAAAAMVVARARSG